MSEKTPKFGREFVEMLAQNCLSNNMYAVNETGAEIEIGREGGILWVRDNCFLEERVRHLPTNPLKLWMLRRRIKARFGKLFTVQNVIVEPSKGRIMVTADRNSSSAPFYR